MINVMGSLLLEEQETWYVKTPHLHAAIMMLSSANRSYLSKIMNKNSVQNMLVMDLGKF